MKIDVHQHFWTESLVDALARRRELPFVRREHGLTLLYLADERPYMIELDAQAPARRAALLERDGLERALVCLSSPLGIESLPREESAVLIEAYHEGALSLGDPFGVWGAIALDQPDPGEVDLALERGCMGISLAAGAIAGVGALCALSPLLARLESLGAPLLVHPGPGLHQRVVAGGAGTALDAPLWWTALTSYVAEMQAAWLAFMSAGRARHPDLRVVFTMLAGLAPLHGERICSRGGPLTLLPDPLTFYETSSYGPAGVRSMQQAVGREQLLYGSDRPVADPDVHGLHRRLDWRALGDAARRALECDGGAGAGPGAPRGHAEVPAP